LYSICMWMSSSSFVNGTSSIGILHTSIPVSFFCFLNKRHCSLVFLLFSVGLFIVLRNRFIVLALIE
jgi:hypothetical protein